MFTPFDNKRYVCDGNIKTYAWGHKDIPVNENQRFYSCKWAKWRGMKIMKNLVCNSTTFYFELIKCTSKLTD